MLTSLEKVAPWAIGLFRIVVGFLFFCHGASTLFGWPVAPYGGETAAFGAGPSWWAAAIELVGGILVMLGLGTRVAAFIGSGAMAVAYFWKHQGDGLLPIANEGDSAALYCWALFLLVFIGSGRPALENVLVRKRVEESDAAASQGSAVRTAA
ncbi:MULTISPECIES: DoxX family protein [Gordonia]|uniref:DoxX family protein n=1 Tax=Gordonia jacobaea TaxID=122202 RepID=A0ABR5IBA5_9ACTN|nr:MULTISPECIES: DoxX family protein [Gordonia]KNA90907.1 DoxX family protein [Gordonia jacobaea]OBC03165.1 DoxX family protein [Gordonia sp. 852002-50395_SCH5434458]OBC10014.1 DoxX family protein [Gordonia sp. 852002-50816_SCH5313054-a]OBC19722.1 DoxX family protein [Gordonia sp. 852002-50816_SCH5313054-c]